MIPGNQVAKHEVLIRILGVCRRDHILFSANYTKVYRYSFTANYYVYNVTTGTTEPLIPDQKADIQYAGWAPTGDKIAFVRGNDLYIWTSGNVERITSDGGPDVFNGVPDWVYEEEVYYDTKTLWWSPDAEYLAFLRMNETGVPTYTVQYFNPGEQKLAPVYPVELDIRYPKVGEKNPTVTFHLLKVGEKEATEVAFESFEPNDLLITEVAWVTDSHSHVIFRTMNRPQDLEKLVLVDVEDEYSTKVVRERDGTDGWIENSLAITWIPKSNPPAYLDLSDHDGWMHLYLYSIDGSFSPKPLTSGEWEVTALIKVDSQRGTVYYLSTQRDSTERHLYSVSLTNPGRNKKALVNTNSPGYWTASFSTGGGYYLLTYEGPNVPYQKLYSVNTDGSKHTLIRDVENNDALRKTMSEYKLPEFRWSKLAHPDGYVLNTLERLPANFNPKKKYPVLVSIYGGPGSQETGKRFRRINEWVTYVGSDPELEYIILTVDNRGTGFLGREFRSCVTRQLGKLEAQDQLYAAQHWTKRPYVDSEHIVIWGWSYGGYLSAKVIEANTHIDIFSRGLITAPVSDWRFYDSIYTERFMKNLSSNPTGYLTSSILDPSGFKKVRGGVLVQHGTGDDNVHFQHTATLTDTLMRLGVGPEKLRSQWFTDSDHSIRRTGHYEFLLRQLADELFEEKRWRREGRHQWDQVEK